MDGYSGTALITFVIVIVFIVILLVLPIIILSTYDRGKHIKAESIQNKQVMTEQSSKPELTSKQIDSEERLMFIIFTVITVMILIPVLYVLFFYE